MIKTPAMLASERDGFTRCVSLGNPPSFTPTSLYKRVQFRQVGHDEIFVGTWETLGQTPLDKVRIDELEWRELP